MRGGGRLIDGIVIATGELFAHVLDEFPAPQFALQRPGDNLAQFTQAQAAAFATGGGGGFNHPLNGQIVRQFTRGAGAADTRFDVRFWCWFGGSDRGLSLDNRLRLFEVFNRQFELLDQQLAALGGLAKLLTPRLGQQQL